MNEENQADSSSETPQGEQRRISLKPVTIILFLIMTLLVIVILGWPYFQARYHLPWTLPISLIPVSTSIEEPTPLQVSVTPSPSPTPSATLPLIESEPDLLAQGLIILALQERLETHLFIYQPIPDQQGRSLGLTRLSRGSWQDSYPALKPDEDKLAFASDRNGFWNIYELDLATGEVNQISNSPDYQGAPTWSPDGKWIGYEALIENNLDIYLQKVDGISETVRLTSHIGADFDPAWAPNGRQIAFVSDRGGRNQVWLANLDDGSSNRFQRLSNNSEISASNPTWSPDGRYLAWSAVNQDGLHRISLWDSEEPGNLAVDVCAGDKAAWSLNGKALAVVLNTPFVAYFSIYSLNVDHTMVLPHVELPGGVEDFVWVEVDVSGNVVLEGVVNDTPLWQEDQVELPGFGGRWDLVDLEDVEAPYPRLHERADESFQAFRVKMASLVGWDLLVDLENAFIPLSSALSPGFTKDWLYTGRAFAFNTLPIKAGWIAVVREDFGPETYWRVFLRTRFQDGSQGRPLQQLPWDFNARYRGDPIPYEQGGDYMEIVPPGYWVDFTRVAAQYGWQRFPALSNWRSAYTSARFNEFAFTESLSWEEAILEIYPPEALFTMTPPPTIFTTPTETSLWFPTSTPTSTPSPSATGEVTLNPSSTASITPTGTSQVVDQSMTSTAAPSPTSTETAAP